MLSVRVPPEAAHFSLEKKELSRVLLCCVCVVLLCFLSRMFIVFIMYMYLSCMCHTEYVGTIPAEEREIVLKDLNREATRLIQVVSTSYHMAFFSL